MQTAGGVKVTTCSSSTARNCRQSMALEPKTISWAPGTSAESPSTTPFSALLLLAPKRKHQSGPRIAFIWIPPFLSQNHCAPPLSTDTRTIVPTTSPRSHTGLRLNRTQRFPHFLLWVSECTEFRDNRALRLRYHSKMSLQFRSRPALVAYLTCGDPDLCTSREVALATISAGADVIELGVRFSDPVADGPVIQRASERALKNGASLQDVLSLAREIRSQSDAGLIIFSYLNPILRMGLARFCAAAADAGADGALLIDLTVEEGQEYRRCMESRQLATIFLAAPTSTDQRLTEI